MKISVTIITRNEEDRIAEALVSVAWTDEIVIVDAESTDRTVEIARQYTDRVIINPWSGYAAQKNFADSQASHDWVLSIDADERVSPELRQSIEQLKREGPRHDGYCIPRRAWYLGRWINHSGWYPDYQLRLYRRDRARWQGDYVHESVRVEGSVGTLSGDLWHFTRRSLAEHHEVLGHYTTLAAAGDFTQGKTAGFLSLLLKPPLTFLRSYILKQGFRDGIPGLVIASFAAYYVFLKQAKLWEKRHLPDGWRTRDS
ncbi:MAG: glycosyltransferase family 2 protein [Acidobacteria bacterium]|nr:glycosyltransferase family 2 protein [Acidobacteriota bacterium]